MASSEPYVSHELGKGQPPGSPSSKQRDWTNHALAKDSSYDDDGITAASNGATGVMEPEEELYEDDQASEQGSDWTNESLMEQHIGLIDDEDYNAAGTECCSLAESKQLRKQLREVGPEEFVRRTLESGAYSVRKLCTAFGVVLPEVDFLTTASEDMFLPLLGALMKRELAKRHRLEDYTTIEDAGDLLRECNNIIVVTGAGISTNLGIPDFRSKGTGLYSRLEHLGLSDPQEVFDISLFREDPTIFYSIAKDIVPATKRFSPTHAFIRLLQDKNKLLTNFTQNIDNLEAAAGILPEKLIQCHGSFATATCQQCGFQCPGDQIADDLKAGRVAKCPACIRRIRQLQPLGLKRKHSYSSTGSKKKRRKDYDGFSSSSESDDDMDVAGVMKPDITFFGEDLPKTFHDRLLQHDKELVDLVIVIGTSLKVSPVADIPDFLPPSIPQIYISRDPVNHIEFDIELLGDCDQIVTELCRRAGWELKHEMVPLEQLLEAKAFDGTSTTRWLLVPKEGSATTKREALDSGTLGHGSALSPSQERSSARSEIAQEGKPVDDKLPVDNNPEEVNLLISKSVEDPPEAALPERIKNSTSPLLDHSGSVGTATQARTDGAEDIEESITLTPQSTSTPPPVPPPLGTANNALP